jgi:hypothetical protein
MLKPRRDYGQNRSHQISEAADNLIKLPYDGNIRGVKSHFLMRLTKCRGNNAVVLRISLTARKSDLPLVRRQMISTASKENIRSRLVGKRKQDAGLSKVRLRNLSRRQLLMLCHQQVM